MEGVSFQLGHASGLGYNCLIDTLRQAMRAGVICNVAAVRASLERRHAHLATRITPGDYLYLDYWADIVDLLGAYNLIRPATKPWSPQFRVVCVDLTWIGNGDVLPRGTLQAGRTTLHIARINQNHFVPLLRLHGDPQPTRSQSSGSSSGFARANHEAAASGQGASSGNGSGASSSGGQRVSDDFPPCALGTSQSGRQAQTQKPRDPTTLPFLQAPTVLGGEVQRCSAQPSGASEERVNGVMLAQKHRTRIAARPAPMRRSHPIPRAIAIALRV